MPSDLFTVGALMQEQATHEHRVYEPERKSSACSGPRLGRRPHRWRNWWASGQHLAVGASLAFGIMACSPSPDAGLGDTVGAASSVTSGPVTSGPVTSGAALAAMGPSDTLTVTVDKTPTCGCCRAWVDDLRARGFRVEAVDRDDLTMVKAANGVPGELQSCHTATVGGYVVEGHVPAGDIRRLLAERPAVAGIAVPGMPVGSPGMEVPGTPAERYDVLSFDRAGAIRTFASH